MTMPHPEVWENAQQVFDNAQGESYGQASPAARRAIDTLGDLLGIYDGYGEDH